MSTHVAPTLATTESPSDSNDKVNHHDIVVVGGGTAGITVAAQLLVKNLRASMAGKPLTAKYNGYTSCPVVTGYGSLVLAEFDYDGNPAESFPFDQATERWSMWLLKKYGLPILYWSGMLKGRA